MKHIVCRIEKCLGCSSCELACAIEHSQSKKLVEAIQEPILPIARIHVELIDEQGTTHRYRTFALQCRHCDDPVCVQACISGGIHKDEDTGDVRFNSERCVGCWSCIMVCPFGAIVKHDGLHRAMKCDHCPGRETPACIEACPTHALVYCEKEDYQVGHILK
jgi:carbon-monoxide dehydrogenase iron sulfur subunit